MLGTCMCMCVKIHDFTPPQTLSDRLQRYTTGTKHPVSTYMVRFDSLQRLIVSWYHLGHVHYGNLVGNARFPQNGTTSALQTPEIRAADATQACSLVLGYLGLLLVHMH